MHSLKSEVFCPLFSQTSGLDNRDAQCCAKFSDKVFSPFCGNENRGQRSFVRALLFSDHVESDRAPSCRNHTVV